MTKPFVLIVEDDPQLGNIFTLALQTDFETELCPTGNEALGRLETLVPAVVVLDLHLPGVSGLDILKHIRESERLKNTRVMLATADHLQADFLQGQADLVLLKPISPFQLRELAVRLTKNNA